MYVHVCMHCHAVKVAVLVPGGPMRTYVYECTYVSTYVYLAFYNLVE